MAADAAAPAIVWFREDLRLADNPALNAALAEGRAVVPAYILETPAAGRAPGGTSRWWLDRSLRALDRSLRERGGRLVLRRGEPGEELRRLADETGARKVFLNRRFDPEGFRRDAGVAAELEGRGIACRGFNAALLRRPGEVLTGSGEPYRVFTPFLRTLLQTTADRPLTAPPTALPPVPDVAGDDIEGWGLRPVAPDWSTGFDWTPGEAGAAAALEAFLDGPVDAYGTDRDLPARAGTSRLSPHLHFGEISPWRVVQATRNAAARRPSAGAGGEKFIAEIGWREFSAHLLHHFPHMPGTALRPAYDAMPWRTAPDELRAWQAGRTGYPFVDAGMRQLWTTGWMHNRVRMIVASFLVKHLLIDWRAGEAWFHDTLVDADAASNAQNWQWVAGSGADAAPFFRIFNPVTQGERFDPQGAYVRRWVPELARLPDRWIHQPWAAPAAVRAEAGVRFRRTYPEPIVDLAAGRARALAAFKSLPDG